MNNIIAEKIKKKDTVFTGSMETFALLLAMFGVIYQPDPLKTLNTESLNPEIGKLYSSETGVASKIFKTNTNDDPAVWFHAGQEDNASQSTDVRDQQFKMGINELLDTIYEGEQDHIDTILLHTIYKKLVLINSGKLAVFRKEEFYNQCPVYIVDDLRNQQLLSSQIIYFIASNYPLSEIKSKTQIEEKDFQAIKVDDVDIYNKNIRLLEEKYSIEDNAKLNYIFFNEQEYNKETDSIPCENQVIVHFVDEANSAAGYESRIRTRYAVTTALVGKEFESVYSGNLIFHKMPLTDLSEMGETLSNPEKILFVSSELFRKKMGSKREFITVLYVKDSILNNNPFESIYYLSKWIAKKYVIEQKYLLEKDEKYIKHNINSINYFFPRGSRSLKEYVYEITQKAFVSEVQQFQKLRRLSGLDDATKITYYNAWATADDKVEKFLDHYQELQNGENPPFNYVNLIPTDKRLVELINYYNCKSKIKEEEIVILSQEGSSYTDYLARNIHGFDILRKLSIDSQPDAVKIIPFRKNIIGLNNLRDESGVGLTGNPFNSYGSHTLDYIKRQLEELKYSLKNNGKAKQDPRLFCIFALKAHDKIILIQLLKKIFPKSKIITTDLDAAYLTNELTYYTNNLLVASSFPLVNYDSSSDDDSGKYITNSFRHVYQSAIYHGMELIFSNNRDSHIKSESTVSPSLYEIGGGKEYELLHYYKYVPETFEGLKKIGSDTDQGILELYKNKINKQKEKLYETINFNGLNKKTLIEMALNEENDNYLYKCRLMTNLELLNTQEQVSINRELIESLLVPIIFHDIDKIDLAYQLQQKNSEFVDFLLSAVDLKWQLYDYLVLIIVQIGLIAILHKVSNKFSLPRIDIIGYGVIFIGIVFVLFLGFYSLSTNYLIEFEPLVFKLGIFSSIFNWRLSFSGVSTYITLIIHLFILLFILFHFYVKTFAEINHKDDIPQLTKLLFSSLDKNSVCIELEQTIIGKCEKGPNKRWYVFAWSFVSILISSSLIGLAIENYSDYLPVYLGIAQPSGIIVYATLFFLMLAVCDLLVNRYFKLIWFVDSITKSLSEMMINSHEEISPEISKIHRKCIYVLLRIVSYAAEINYQKQWVPIVSVLMLSMSMSPLLDNWVWTPGLRLYFLIIMALIIGNWAIVSRKLKYFDSLALSYLKNNVKYYNDETSNLILDETAYHTSGFYGRILSNPVIFICFIVIGGSGLVSVINKFVG